MQMKIVFNTMGLGKGGAERVINLLANSFAVKHEVTIITNINSKVEYDFNNRISIISLSKNDNYIARKLRRFSIPILFRLKKILIDINPDIIISFLPEPSFRVLALKKHFKSIRNIPTIVSVRNDPNTEYNNKLYYYIMKKLYPYADQLILQTNDSKSYFEKHINYNGVVIPNPVSDTFLSKKYSGTRDKRIVAVGRLEPQKNYKNMIDGFELVHNKHPEYKFEIYGDGVLKSDLQKYINSKEMNNNIVLMGKTDDVKKAIYNAKLFVMSSDYEGMPNSLLEAACLGVPCVSTDCPCGGPREILDEGKGGLLVETKNPIKLSEAIIKLIENEDLADAISTYSNKKSILYKKENIIKKWIYEICQLVNGDEDNV